LVLGVLLGACFTSVRQTQAQHSAADYDRQGAAWVKKGEYDQAIADYNQAVRLDPDYAYAYNNRGKAWNRKKEYDRAIADLNQAIRLDPNYAHAYNNRGNAWSGKKEYDRAIADYNQALRLDPNYAYACNSLAWFQATCPDARFRDGRKAFENASRAYQLSGGKDAAILDTLSAAYAENSDFDSARQWETKAIALLTNEKEQQQEYRSRLRLYEQRKPCRQEP
jgi:tetratricopeptide (TPR) repeat protein